MSYILATTGDRVRWYRFDVLSIARPLPFELVDELDLSSVPQFGEKALAKAAAQALGLKGWRYVRL